jgi:hypothetical protein
MYFGTDPEFVVYDAAGRPVPAHRAGIRTKEKKHCSKGQEWSFFRDGYMLELNVYPSPCRQSLTFTVQRALRAASAFLAKQGYHLGSSPAVTIDLKRDMRRAPVDVRQFGCKPSFCAHDLVTKVPPIDAMTHPLRYAGTHLHYSAHRRWPGHHGYDYPWLNDPDAYPDLAKLQDQYVGLPLTCLYHSPEQYLRRRFYGQAGEYRAQTYPDGQRGFEYRTPGPEFWDTPWLSSLMLGISRDVIKNFPRLRKTLSKGRVAAVRHAIDTGEHRWKLLKSLPTARVSLWKPLYECLQKTPRYRGPRCLIEATPGDIMAGYAQWDRA